ncbi:MAG: hypothetical protein NZZ41_02880 [Candidatus Dojkabacteria bacterium]|nr:hypothetical protein [Candidatus Dojkabacteria bacterium]
MFKQRINEYSQSIDELEKRTNALVDSALVVAEMIAELKRKPTKAEFMERIGGREELREQILKMDIDNQSNVVDMLLDGKHLYDVHDTMKRQRALVNLQNSVMKLVNEE